MSDKESIENKIKNLERRSHECCQIGDQDTAMWLEVKATDAFNKKLALLHKQSQAEQEC